MTERGQYLKSKHIPVGNGGAGAAHGDCCAACSSGRVLHEHERRAGGTGRMRGERGLASPGPLVFSLLVVELLAAAKTQELLRVVVRVALAVLLAALLALLVAPKALAPLLFDKSIPAIPNTLKLPPGAAVKFAVIELVFCTVPARAYQTSQSPPCS